MLLTAVILAVPVSCRGGRPERISLPSTPVLSIRSTWAAVKSPLLRVRAEPSNKSEVLSHVRIGVVVEVIARSDNEETLENEVAYWYRINYDGLKGWVFGSYLEIFDSRSLAEKYAEKLQ
ncbi:MAG: SH3 domain-containing protein [Spirochaetes bacterium]|nr:SH3 domain-containing protein [Spirochaetota bacterium]